MEATMTEHRDRQFGRTRDVWGDDPVEREAETFVEEVLAAEPDEARRWYHHPAVVPFTVVARFIGRNGRRVGITIAGFAVILAGIALLVLPGPGWLLIFIGLSILATEYVWAQRLLRTAKAKATAAKDAVLQKKQRKADSAEA
jgi:hypothetical protein